RRGENGLRRCFASVVGGVLGGSKAYGYEVINRKRIDDFDLTAVHVAFHTAPADSTGVPHILEHTALCGSAKYPVRDPFFKMMNRSVSTDVTMYPFSTENKKDYYNLFGIYMDATMHPRLRETDFRQEGWRLEHENPKDPSTPIIFKGVVYNEMKGVFSDVNNIFLQRLQQVFYPGTTYSHVSGGHPDAITDLTHKQLVDFHRRHYHPSNAKFFTYDYRPIHIDSLKTFGEPRRIVETCPFDPMGDPERQVRLSISYLTNDGTNTFETSVMNILSKLLVGGAASPFYKEETSFSIGLQGIKESDIELVENKIYKVFEEVAKSGFPKERVESAIHQLELGIRHRKANFGMGLGQSVLQHWVHGGDPIAAMEVTPNIKKLREALSTPGFFESRIKKYFLQNPHRLVFVMKPSESYSVQVEESEKKRLDEKVEKLSEEEKKRLHVEGIELLKLQEAPEDLSCLPTVTLADISKKGKTYLVTDKVLKHSCVPVQVRETATNGVSYIRINKSIKDLPETLVPFLSLYTFTALGTRTTPSLADLDERIRLTTSGISASPSLSSLPTGADFMHPDVVERIRTVLAFAASNGMSSLADQGHRYAVGAAGATLKPVLKKRALVGGLESIVFTNKLFEKGDAGVQELIEKIKGINDFIVKQDRPLKAAVNSVPEAVAVNENGLSELFSTLGWKSAPKTTDNDSTFKPQYNNTFYAFPFNVNYTGQAFLAAPYVHEDSPKLQVLAELLTHRFLHREVREKGGAYGGFASYSSIDGIFSMASYRDPPGAGVRTMDAFARGVEWAGQISNNVTQLELNEAKMSILGSLDSPLSASDEAMTRYSTGITDEMLQKRRDMFFALDLASVEAVAQKYLTQPSSKAILGPKQEAESLKGGNWNVQDFS
ncbi:Metalloenzyme, LuxS/M16 peptidase-like protein, partial [Chytridium lagenaria]